MPNYDDLTPQAKELVKNPFEIKGCYNCGGTGVMYQQPYGTKVLCNVCHGTGKETNL